MQYKQDHLRKSELFSELEDRDIDRLAEYAEYRHFPRGHLIVREGSIEIENLSMYIMVSGQVEILRRTGEGGQHRLAVLGPGECFGELSVIDGQPRSASALALEDVACLVLTAIDFRDFLESAPKVAHNLLRVVIGRLRIADAMLVD